VTADGFGWIEQRQANAKRNRTMQAAVPSATSISLGLLRDFHRHEARKHQDRHKKEGYKSVMHGLGSLLSRGGYFVYPLNIGHLLGFRYPTEAVLCELLGYTFSHLRGIDLCRRHRLLSGE
jgi:hypothetical protein